MYKLSAIKCLLIPIVGMLGSVAMAGVDNSYSETTPAITVTQAQPQFIIKLKSNPTTGYKWFLRKYNQKFIMLVKHEFAVPQTKMIGAPGIEMWTFRVKPLAFVVAQPISIRFLYARPWDKGDHATQVMFKITPKLR